MIWRRLRLRLTNGSSDFGNDPNSEAPRIIVVENRYIVTPQSSCSFSCWRLNKLMTFGDSRRNGSFLTKSTPNQMSIKSTITTSARDFLIASLASA